MVNSKKDRQRAIKNRHESTDETKGLFCIQKLEIFKMDNHLLEDRPEGSKSFSYFQG